MECLVGVPRESACSSCSTCLALRVIQVNQVSKCYWMGAEGSSNGKGHTYSVRGAIGQKPFSPVELGPAGALSESDEHLGKKPTSSGQQRLNVLSWHDG